jgi:RNA methyltransferase, TrmH family
MPETLASEKNPLLKAVRHAVASGSLTKDGFAVAEGFHLLEEAIRARCAIAAVIAAEPALSQVLGPVLGEVKKRLPANVRIVPVSERTFSGLASTQTPQPVIALVRPPQWTFEDVLRDRALALVLDGIQDPGNAGAILRSAEAFGATGVIFLKCSVNPYNPKCVRASAGSIFRLPALAGVEGDALEARFQGVRMYAALPRAERSIAEADFRQGCAIAIGSEARGVGETVRRIASGVRIPTQGVESLNAAVAAGILLYEASRQRLA